MIQVIQSVAIQLLIVLPYKFFFYFCEYNSNFSFIPDTSSLLFFNFFSVSQAKGLLNFMRNQLLVSIHLLSVLSSLRIEVAS